MKIRLSSGVLGLLLALGGCTSCTDHEAPRRLGEGMMGAFAPDGRRIAFEVDRKDRMDLGVLDLATGRTEWVRRGEGNAAHPAWGADGSLYYTYCIDTNTAFAAAKARTGDGSCLIWKWKNGVHERVTATPAGERCRDWSPSVAPDGTLWFMTSYGSVARGVNFCRASIAKLTDGKREVVANYSGQSSGAGSPVVSPDGRFLAFAEQRSLRGNWRIAVARVASPTEMCYLTEDTSVCYSPAWSPDGRFLAYTGYRVGDSGWSVYVQEVATGREVRICEGRNPSFSPDGRRLVYDDGSSLLLRAAEWSLSEGHPESPMTPVHYVAATVTVPKTVEYRKVRSRADNIYIHAQDVPRGRDAFSLFLREGFPYVASRCADGTPLFVNASSKVEKGKPIRLVAVRAGRYLMLYVDGRLVGKTDGDILPMDNARPARWMEQAEGVVAVDRASGTGWPGELPTPPTRTAFFGKEGK